MFTIEISIQYHFYSLYIPLHRIQDPAKAGDSPVKSKTTVQNDL
jgi:hypothetical protein